MHRHVARLAGHARFRARHASTDASSSPKVAFYGIGNMGRGMALNLSKAGFEVTAFDPTAAARDAAAAAGLRVAATVEGAAEGAEYVVSMLPTGEHALDLYLGQDGLLKRSSVATLVDCSTIDSQTARELGAAAAERGLGFLDAPVSGGTAAAAAGTLAFMCGGAVETFERARPLLGAMGAKLFHAGPAGAGQVAKACNNMLLAIHMIGSTEVLSLGARAGLAPDKLSEILLASSGRNWVRQRDSNSRGPPAGCGIIRLCRARCLLRWPAKWLRVSPLQSLEVYNPYPGVMEAAPASKGFAPGFMTDLMVKDLGLALHAADSAGLDVRMGRLAKELYEEHQSDGHGHLDFSSIINRLGPRAPD